MKLRFKQIVFSWFSGSKVYDETGRILFTVKSCRDWGYCLHILDAAGEQVASIQRRTSTFLPSYDLFAYGEYLGRMKQRITLLKPQFCIEGSDWVVTGNAMGSEYAITSPRQGLVASASKERCQLNNIYALDVEDTANTLCSLMIVLAVGQYR